MTDAVHFNRIEVRRMPGFPRGGLELDGLAAGVNVIYGPNASGKTTLSRAMQQMLRPHAAERQTNSLAADLHVAGTLFELVDHVGQVTCRSGGSETSLPPLAPAEVGDRYVLALHDLVKSEYEEDVVSQILREVAGGFDVAQAARELEFDRDRPRSRNIRASSDYQEAVRKRKDAAQRLEEIGHEARQLDDLKRQRNEAHQAQLRQRVIEDAINALEQNRNLEEAQRALSDFPAGMSKLTGDEWERLTDIKNELQPQRDALTSANALLEDAEAEIQATGLSEESVPAELVNTLQNQCESLQEHARKIDNLNIEFEGHSQEANNALARLGSEVTLERASSLDSGTLEQLFKFIGQVEECSAEGKAAERTASWLHVDPRENANPNTLRDGMQLLQKWLAQQRPSPQKEQTKSEWFVAAGVAVVLSVVMAAVADPSWLVLLVLAAGLVAWAFLRQRHQATPVVGEDIPTQWSGTGLPPPTTWSSAEVQATLRRLEEELAAARLGEQKRQRFADLQQRRDRYEERKQQIASIRANWHNQLGLEIDPDDTRLYLLAQEIHQVQSAQCRIEAAQAKLAQAQQQRDLLLKSINDALAPYVDAPATDAYRASALVRHLDTRRQDHRNALGRRRQATETISKCNDRIEQLQSDRATLFENLSLPPDDELTLHQWCEQFPRYRDALEAVRLAKHDAHNAAASLAEHEELLKQTREQLETELEECRQRADELGELDEKIGGIHRLVDQAKKETALEDSLTAEQRCLDELRAERDNDAAQLVGNVLFGYLERQQREVQQPGLLKRAVELFAGITHGRYQLLVSTGGSSPGFLARDTSLGQDQNLDELSSGTRVQLLLAVRLAFVEQQEQGLKLPLIFDETLGNSDEQRACRIIEAAVEIARSGRQVFYFTAQHDELGKWRRVLSESDGFVHQEFDLARIRGFSELEQAPPTLDLEPARPIPVPAPDGDDWTAYGRRLQVPPLDRRGHIGDIHLWYLIDDVQELHRLLNRDVNKWGQLQTLVEIGSADGLDHESLVFQNAAASARLVQHLLRCWRQGRGEPLDRSVLEASGAVSDRFIDDVSQLVQAHDGEARQLIDDLRAGKVQQFRTTQIDKLEQYLTENSYLDDQPILDPSEIRETIGPLVFADRENGLLPSARVEQLIAVVTSRPPE